jgi:hypothetical protein
MQSTPPLFKGFLKHEIGVLQTVLKGKSKSVSVDASAETELLRILLERLEKLS